MRSMKPPIRLSGVTSDFYVKDVSPYPPTWSSSKAKDMASRKIVPLARSPGTPPRPPPHLKGNIRKSYRKGSSSGGLNNLHVVLSFVTYLLVVVLIWKMKDASELVWENGNSDVEKPNFLGLMEYNRLENIVFSSYGLKNMTGKESATDVWNGDYVESEEEPEMDESLADKSAMFRRSNPRAGDAALIVRSLLDDPGSNATSFCEEHSESPTMAAISNQTIVIMTCRPSALNSAAAEMVGFLADRSFVNRVLILLEGGQVADFDRSISLHPKVTMTAVVSSSPTFRHLPRALLLTTSLTLVNCMDTEARISLIEFAFRVWSSNKGRLVGTHPMGHVLQPGTTNSWKTHIGQNDMGSFSLIRGSPMVVSTDLLVQLNCQAPAGLLTLAETSRICADVALNFAAANASKAGPVMVSKGSVDGNAWGEEAVEEASSCLTAMAALLGSNPLQWSIGQVSAVPLVADALCRRNGILIACEDNPSGSLQVTHNSGITNASLRAPVSPAGTRYAYAFLIFSPKLVKVAAVASQSLRLTGTRHDIVLMTGGAATAMAPELSAIARAHFTSVVPVEYVRNPHSHNSYSKIHAWSLTDYTAVVYLDIDVLIIENIDHLFSLGPFAAAPDVYHATRFNSGVMVLEPSLDTYSRMVAMARRIQSYNGDDQGFLNSFHDSWYTMGARHRLHFKFNAILHFPRGRYHSLLDVDTAHEALGPLAIVHFANPWFKPWTKGRLYCSVWCQAWLRVFDELESNSWQVLGARPLLVNFSLVIQKHNDSASNGDQLPEKEWKKEEWPWNRTVLSSPLEDRYVRSDVGLNYSLDVFATMLTDPLQAFHLGVWGLSYREHHYGYRRKVPSTRPTLLLVLSSIPEQVWRPYKRLFQEVVVVDPVTAMVDGQETVLDPKFTVLHLWNQSQYSRIVFVDSLSLFWDNCNGILDWKSFAAAPCALPGDWFNWRTMVISPNSRTFQDMQAKLSSVLYPRHSIDSFLNAYYNTWFSSPPPHRLPLSYAVDVLLKAFGMVKVHPWKIISFHPNLPPYGNLSTAIGEGHMQAMARWQTVFCRLRRILRPQHLNWICDVA